MEDALMPRQSSSFLRYSYPIFTKRALWVIWICFKVGLRCLWVIVLVVVVCVIFWLFMSFVREWKIYIHIHTHETRIFESFFFLNQKSKPKSSNFLSFQPNKIQSYLSPFFNYLKGISLKLNKIISFSLIFLLKLFKIYSITYIFL